MTRASDLLESLAMCLCGRIAENPGPETCFCGVIPGDQTVASYSGECDEHDDECGMSWVRLVALYPAASVGQLSELSGNCSSMLGMDIEIGILRCVDVGEVDGSTPSAATLLAQTQQQVQDAMTLWESVACCSDLTSKDYVLGAYQPLGPLGGYMGGAMSVSVML